MFSCKAVFAHCFPQKCQWDEKPQVINRWKNITAAIIIVCSICEVLCSFQRGFICSRRQFPWKESLERRWGGRGGGLHTQDPATCYRLSCKEKVSSGSLDNSLTWLMNRNKESCSSFKPLYEVQKVCSFLQDGILCGGFMKLWSRRSLRLELGSPFAGPGPHRCLASKRCSRDAYIQDWPAGWIGEGMSGGEQVQCEFCFIEVMLQNFGTWR